MKYTCAYCQKHSCHKNEMEKAPQNCPTKNEKKELEEISKVYNDKENYNIAKASAEVVMDNYGTKPRVIFVIKWNIKK